MESDTTKGLIRPVEYLMNNQCPKCRGKLHLVETEVFTASLDKKGLPINQNDYFDTKLKCDACGEEYDADKKGMYYTIRRTTKKVKKIMTDFNPFYSN